MRLPQDEYDIDILASCEKVKPEQLKPLISGLIPWMKNMAWPVAPIVAMIIKPHVHLFFEDIVKAIEGSDEELSISLVTEFFLTMDTSIPKPYLERMKTKAQNCKNSRLVQLITKVTQRSDPWAT